MTILQIVVHINMGMMLGTGNTGRNPQVILHLMDPQPGGEMITQGYNQHGFAEGSHLGKMLGTDSSHLSLLSS